MSMAAHRLLPFVPLTAALLWAAVEDLRTREIRNWLTFSLLLTGLVQSFMPGRTVSPGESALGLLAGFALPLLLVRHRRPGRRRRETADGDRGVDRGGSDTGRSSPSRR